MTLQPAPLWKRMLSALYDALAVFGLLIGVFVLIFFLAIAIFGQHAVVEEHILWGSWIVRGLMFTAVFAYFHLSWRYGGQTLGMKAWKLYVVRPDARPITLHQSFIRFIIGIWGVGWLACLLDAQKRALQDIISGTRLLQKASEN